MAQYDVSGKFAVVTGGGSGIGLAFVKLLLEEGCSVIVGDLSLRPEAEALAKAYPHPPADESGKPSFAFHKTDVTSWRDLSSLWKMALATFPRVDIVVPAAGIFEPPWSDFWHPPGVEDGPSRDDADAETGAYLTYSVNLVHPTRLSQLAIGYWTTNKLPGNLVFVASLASYTATIGTPLYFASKAGLKGLVMSLGHLHKRLGIRVTAVAPSWVRTPMFDQEYCNEILADGGLALTPEHVAEVMLDLAENEKYGDGEIVEVIQRDEPKPTVRVVPVRDLAPPGLGENMKPGMIAKAAELMQRLETEGLQV
ncbi:NAD(P)-binding protein [Xylariomycetidae sp. FL0641]|nr:NAD(P)-binding protein [Xylariomycetidae sp. FL0641]